MAGLSGLPDPCPRPETLKRKALNDRQRLLYAPMADLGGLVYDKDAVYIDIPDWKVPGCLPASVSPVQPMKAAACFQSIVTLHFA